MATTTKKGSKITKSNPRRPKLKTSMAEQAQTNAELRQQLAEALEREKTALKGLQDRDQQLAQSAKELQDCKQELKESLEQQTATSEILGVIASSPTDLQPVLDAIAQSAARVCGSDDATIRRLESDEVIPVAHYGTIPPGLARRPVTWRTPGNEAILQRRTIHISDVLVEAERFPDRPHWPLRGGQTRDSRGIRTFLVTPLLREGTAIGVINIRRTEVKPFTDKQVALLETFASQAVIAIENVRLFKELEARNRDLTKALEQQVATAEILKVIRGSPIDVQPIFDAIIASAVRLCNAEFGWLHRFDGEMVHFVAHRGLSPEALAVVQRAYPMRPDRTQVTGRAILARDVVVIEDQLADPEYRQDFASAEQTRSALGVPMLRDGEPLGVIVIKRTESGPFPDEEITLLQTFANQAVIAIENVRLFRELKESLEQQTATSEILGVIASSPTDIQPVLDVVAQNAARLCDASDAAIWRSEGDKYWLVASHGSIPVPRSEKSRPMTRAIPSGRAMFDKETVHVHDILSPDSLAEFPEAARLGNVRTVLVTPLLREGLVIGAIHIRRTEVRPFTEKQIALLKTFADQAVIAIENVRLFKELEERNAELREALEHQTATSEVLGIISRSPTDVQPVLDAIVES